MRRLRVVSWNVGRLYTPTSNNRLDDHDIPRVGRVLDELRPDVALVQEVVDARQLSALSSWLPGYAAAISTRCLYDRKVAVLVRADLAPEFEQLDLPATGRGVVLATFDAGGERAAACPLHFDVFNPKRRRKQAEDIVQLVGTRRESLVVAGGDLNLDPRLAARIDGGHLDIDTFAMLTSHMTDGGHHLEPSLMSLFRVDHVFARGPRLKSLRTRVSPRRRLPLGDHDPLVCDLELA
jgi:endonuclease/exonuclease/phosphatase family metal-dependent hydrolase